MILNCAQVKLFRQAYHLLPFQAVRALPHFPSLQLFREYFPQLNANKYNQ